MDTYASPSRPDMPWLRRFAWLLCAATFVLLFLGGQVKSHDAGLAVPDWPLTYNENPITYPPSKWVGGIFHEHFHRLFAGGVAMLTVVMCGWLWFAERRMWMKILGTVAVGSVLLQSLLGGLTVWYGLPDAVSSAHGILAQTFFVITILIAYGLSRERQARDASVAQSGTETRTPVHVAAIVLIGLLYLQLLLGALTRHTDSALAIPDFPTTAGQMVPAFNETTVAWVNDWRLDHNFEYGRDLPPVELWQIQLQFAHRVGAVVVTLFILFLAWLALRHEKANPRTVVVAYALCALVLVQFMLGIMTVLTAESPLLATAHLAGGAALLGGAVLLALRAWPLGPREAQTAAGAELRPSST